MAPELKIWLHRQPTPRDWKKWAKRGELVPSVVIERHPGLKRWAARHCTYVPRMDVLRTIFPDLSK